MVDCQAKCKMKVSIPRFEQFLPENALREVIKRRKIEDAIFACLSDLHLLKQGLTHLELSLQNITTFDAFSGKNWQNRGMKPTEVDFGLDSG